LLQYYALILNYGKVDFDTYVLHAGILEETLKLYIESKIDLARKYKEENSKGYFFWFFLIF
jgi:hypothetical protein